MRFLLCMCGSATGNNTVSVCDTNSYPNISCSTKVHVVVFRPTNYIMPTTW